MNSRFRRKPAFLAAIALASVTAYASGQGITSKLSVTDLLTKSLGVTKDQAAGGVGSILSLAQGKLQASDYTKVASAVPGADGYVQKAKDLGAVPADGISAAACKRDFGTLRWPIQAKTTTVIGMRKRAAQCPLLAQS